MPYYYLDISLEFQNDQTDHVSTEAFFKKHIVQHMRKIFGESGAGAPIDILYYDQEENRALLRVPADYYVKLHSALTLCGEYEGKPCAYRIHKTSDLLISFSADSRNFEHN